MSASGPWGDGDPGELLDHLAEGLQLIAPGFRYAYLNRAAASHGQRPRDELLGRTMMECYPGIEETEMFSHLARLMEEGGTHQMENEFSVDEGESRWFELRMERVPKGVLILSIDVTARKKLEMQMRRIQRMDAVGQLAGGVAHDFNNILTIVQSYASFVAEDLPPDHPNAADVRQVLEASKRGASLTRTLLTFARQAPSSPSTLSVGEAMAQLAVLLRRTLGEHIVFETNVALDVGDVKMDPSAFDQVLVNLILNARDAVAEGGRVTVEAERVEVDRAWSVGRGARLSPGAYVMVTVSDDGEGIAPEHAERIFEPFFTTKPEGQGTGLGLATCWGLVEQAGGALNVYSELGGGTTFRVYLPRTDQPVARREVQQSTDFPGYGETLLVVEDQDHVRQLMVRVLREKGFHVIEASSGAEALLLAEDIGDRLELLVTDVVMPRMGGLELSRRLRGRFPELRVLLASGFTPRSLGEMGDADAFTLGKPFTPLQLVLAVRTALDAER